jgi:vancomycin permeability regulator SanA
MNTPIARTTALWLGAFTLFCLLAPGGRENLWWIDVRPLPQGVLALPGLLLLAHAVSPHRLARPTVLLLGAVALWNAVRVRALGVAFPFSLLVAAVLLALPWAPRTRWPRLAAVAAFATLTLGFPAAQTYFFGRTDYARPADVIVVFGARCYADGKPTRTLEDRVRTACRLYREGLAPRLLFSGGPGDGEVHETEAMRRLALDLGVPEEAIRLDRDGLDTAATVAHTGPGRILAVSHFYHLPRVKLAYRQAGRTAYTVPAEEAYRVSGTSFFITREVAAFWWYLLRSGLHLRR